MLYRRLAAALQATASVVIAMSIFSVIWAPETPADTDIPEELPVIEDTAYPLGTEKEPPEFMEFEPEHEPVVLLDVPGVESGFKAWMDYRCIKDKSSTQYKLQENLWVDDNGFCRWGDEGYYMVALGTYYSPRAGMVFRISFEGGGEILAITGDVKADIHTDERHQHRNGNVVEFLVDTGKISRDCLLMGDMSWAAKDFCGKVLSIVLLPERSVVPD